MQLSRNLHIHHVHLSRNLHILSAFKSKVAHTLCTFKPKFAHTLCANKPCLKRKYNPGFCTLSFARGWVPFAACDGCTQAGACPNREQQEEERNRSPELWSWEQQWEREHCCSLLSLTTYLTCSLPAIPDNTRHSNGGDIARHGYVMVCELPIPGLVERGVPVIVARTSWALPTSTYWNTARVDPMLPYCTWEHV